MYEILSRMHLELNIGDLQEPVEQEVVCAIFVIDDVLVCGQAAESSAISSRNSDTGWPLCIHRDIPLSPILRQPACAEARENPAVLGVQQAASHAQGVHHFGTPYPVACYLRF
jgi:hypothetical protein